jgi:DNA-binding GntR family transcriptional regulator
MVPSSTQAISSSMTRASPRADTAYQALRRAIIEQALPPGTKLPEDEIGTHFHMSRTLVRATLMRLQTQGLVDTRPKRTATVARPTLKEAKEVFTIRRVLEREVVRQAVEKWSEDFGAELEGHIRAEESAKAAGDERVSIRLAGEFHTTLATLSGNALLERYVGELVSRCSLILALYGRPHSSDCAIAEHREIVAALRRRDAPAAIDLMDRHIGAVEQRALIADETGRRPDLQAVLARYTEATASVRAAVPFPKTTRRKKG